MAASTVQITVKELAPSGAAANAGFRMGFIDSIGCPVDYTLLAGNVKEIMSAHLVGDSGGTARIMDITGSNKLKNRSIGSTGLVSGIIIFK